MNLLAALALTAIMGVTPATGTFSANQPFNAAITIDGGGTAFNAAQATVTLTNLQVIAYQPGDCGFTFLGVPGGTPSANNLSFIGATLGFSQQKCTVENVVVQPLKKGPAAITISNAQVVSYDGAQPLLGSVVNGTYQVTKVQQSDKTQLHSTNRK